MIPGPLYKICKKCITIRNIPEKIIINNVLLISNKSGWINTINKNVEIHQLTMLVFSVTGDLFPVHEQDSQLDGKIDI